MCRADGVAVPGWALLPEATPKGKIYILNSHFHMPATQERGDKQMVTQPTACRGPRPQHGAESQARWAPKLQGWRWRGKHSYSLPGREPERRGSAESERPVPVRASLAGLRLSTEQRAHVGREGRLKRCRENNLEAPTGQEWLTVPASSMERPPNTQGTW